jgi:UDP-N-acetylmuramoylalanine--D-glutamate ligase
MTTLVLGVGVSGIAAARLARSLGHDVQFFDERLDASAPSGFQPTSIAVGEWSSHLLDGVDLVITSPGFPPTSRPLRDAHTLGVPVVTEIGFALDLVDTPYLAVTGTNGKTTVTELVAAMLVDSGVDAVPIGNIGTPAADVIGATHDVLVVELSSFQLHWWTPTPIGVALVNIAPDHLDWHGGFDQYRAAKSKILDGLLPGSVIAYDGDDPVASDVVERADVDAVRVPCSGRRLPDGGNGVDHSGLVVGRDRYRVDSSDASYLVDVAIAATVAKAAGATPVGVQATIERFVPGAHRRHVVAVIDDVTYVNDSKATNPHAAVAAIGAFSNVRLLAGGRNKAIDLSALGRTDGVVHIYAFGESGPEIAAAATNPTTVHSSMLDAVKAARADAQAGDTVLLSPGCTSFDEFTSYAERGKAFEKTVRSMDEGDPQ